MHLVRASCRYVANLVSRLRAVTSRSNFRLSEFGDYVREIPGMTIAQCYPQNSKIGGGEQAVLHPCAHCLRTSNSGRPPVGVVVNVAGWVRPLCTRMN